jgi:hypothetical protein
LKEPLDLPNRLDCATVETLILECSSKTVQAKCLLLEKGPNLKSLELDTNDIHVNAFQDSFIGVYFSEPLQHIWISLIKDG